jgi:hypothetical protein
MNLTIPKHEKLSIGYIWKIKHSLHLLWYVLMWLHPKNVID